MSIDFTLPPDVEETGVSYLENALLKARSVAGIVGWWRGAASPVASPRSKIEP